MITVNALSKHSGVSAHTVRYYSRIGLLNPRRDPNNGYRVFDSADLNRLRFIRSAQHLGFTLNEIFEILAISEEGHSPCQRVRDILSRRIRENQRKIEELVCLQARMKKTLALWRNLPDGVSGKNGVCRLIDSASEALRTGSYDMLEEGHYV
jgi:DNA-binding transcriptional MerR regulator